MARNCGCAARKAGSAGATTWLYAGTDNGYDRLQDNGPATVTALAEAGGTVIGLYGYANGVDVFQGAADGDTVLEDIWSNQTLFLMAWAFVLSGPIRLLFRRRVPPAGPAMPGAAGPPATGESNPRSSSVEF